MSAGRKRLFSTIIYNPDGEILLVQPDDTEWWSAPLIWTSVQGHKEFILGEVKRQTGLEIQLEEEFGFYYGDKTTPKGSGAIKVYEAKVKGGDLKLGYRPNLFFPGNQRLKIKYDHSKWFSPEEMSTLEGMDPDLRAHFRNFELAFRDTTDSSPYYQKLVETLPLSSRYAELVRSLPPKKAIPSTLLEKMRL